MDTPVSEQKKRGPDNLTKKEEKREGDMNTRFNTKSGPGKTSEKEVLEEKKKRGNTSKMGQLHSIKTITRPQTV